MKSVNDKLKFLIHRFRKSFTLVELSIVLMVMSILTATTLVGRSLVYQAYAKTIIEHQQEYHQAITDFFMTYHALPGDFNDAQYQLAKSGYTTKTMSEIKSLTAVEQFKIPLNGNGNGKVDRLTFFVGFQHARIFRKLSNNRVLLGLGRYVGNLFETPNHFPFAQKSLQ